jgi:hypothetical protein
VARNDHGHRRQKEIVDVVPAFSAHLQHVAKALGAQQAHLGARALQHGVGDERGAVDHIGDLRRVGARFRQQALDALDDRPAGRIWRGETLADARDATRLIVQNEIGEGAADVDTDACGALHCVPPPTDSAACG